MKKLHNKVNIVPVIAKSDVLTKKEIQKLKKRVNKKNNIIFFVANYSLNIINEISLRMKFAEGNTNVSII